MLPKNRYMRRHRLIVDRRERKGEEPDGCLNCHGRCRATFKTIFVSEDAAKNFIATASESNRKRKPNRAYICQHCNGWHVTSDFDANAIAGDIESFVIEQKEKN